MIGPITYKTLCQKERELLKSFRFLTPITLGESVCGKPIEAISVGCGKKTVMMNACHHGSEHLTSALLLDFLEEIALCLECGERRFALNLRSLFECRRLILVPTVNPDGVALATEGLDAASPRAERLIALNEGSRDFSKWQANARGVDLNHNYDYRFLEYKRLEAERGIEPGATLFSGNHPESEPETSALCRFVRDNQHALSAVLSFHSQGEVIYCHDSQKNRHAAEFFHRLTGYAVERADGTAAFGGFSDWLSLLGIPALTIEIGKGENPLPDALSPTLYAELREALFRFLFFF